MNCMSKAGLVVCGLYIVYFCLKLWKSVVQLIKYMCKVMEHAKNSQVHFLTKLSISTPRSVIGSNLRTVKKRLHNNNLATLMDEGCKKKLREAYITEST